MPETPPTLLTFLGKGRDDPQTGYRTATYRFPNGAEEITPFFGLALANHLQPQKVVLLGTAGSMWGVLVEHFMQGADQEDLRLELLDAQTQGTVTQALLDRVTPLLQQSLAHTVVLRLIPSGLSTAEQIGILEVIHDALGKKAAAIHLDLTHGYRHLAAIGFASAAMLERLQSQLAIAGIWYGALEMSQDGITPVIRMDGLHTVQQWVSALNRYDASGNTAVFAPLLQKDGLAAEKARCLEEAAFFEMTTQIASAALSLRTLLPTLDAPLTGASALFQEQLQKRLQWAREPELAEQQRILAKRALDRHDLLRAAILALESFISRQASSHGNDPRDYDARKRAVEAIELSIKKGDQPDWLGKAYWDTKNLRNSLAHGTQPNYKYLQQLLENQNQLHAAMEANLGLLSTAQLQSRP